MRKTYNILPDKFNYCISNYEINIESIEEFGRVSNGLNISCIHFSCNGIELPLLILLTSRLPVPLRQSEAMRQWELAKQLEWAWVPENLEFLSANLTGGNRNAPTRTSHHDI